MESIYNFIKSYSDWVYLHWQIMEDPETRWFLMQLVWMKIHYFMRVSPVGIDDILIGTMLTLMGLFFAGFDLFWVEAINNYYTKEMEYEVGILPDLSDLATSDTPLAACLRGDDPSTIKWDITDAQVRKYMNWWAEKEEEYYGYEMTEEDWEYVVNSFQRPTWAQWLKDTIGPFVHYGSKKPQMPWDVFYKYEKPSPVLNAYVSNYDITKHISYGLGLLDKREYEYWDKLDYLDFREHFPKRPIPWCVVLEKFDEDPSIHYDNYYDNDPLSFYNPETHKLSYNDDLGTIKRKIYLNELYKDNIRRVLVADKKWDQLRLFDANSCWTQIDKQLEHEYQWLLNRYEKVLNDPQQQLYAKVWYCRFGKAHEKAQEIAFNKFIARLPDEPLEKLHDEAHQKAFQQFNRSLGTKYYKIDPFYYPAKVWQKVSNNPFYEMKHSKQMQLELEKIRNEWMQEEHKKYIAERETEILKGSPRFYNSLNKNNWRSLVQPIYTHEWEGLTGKRIDILQNKLGVYVDTPNWQNIELQIAKTSSAQQTRAFNYLRRCNELHFYYIDKFDWNLHADELDPKLIMYYDHYRTEAHKYMAQPNNDYTQPILNYKWKWLGALSEVERAPWETVEDFTPEKFRSGEYKYYELERKPVYGPYQCSAKGKMKDTEGTYILMKRRVTPWEDKEHYINYYNLPETEYSKEELEMIEQRRQREAAYTKRALEWANQDFSKYWTPEDYATICEDSRKQYAEELKNRDPTRIYPEDYYTPEERAVHNYSSFSSPHVGSDGEMEREFPPKPSKYIADLFGSSVNSTYIESDAEEEAIGSAHYNEKNRNHNALEDKNYESDYEEYDEANVDRENKKEYKLTPADEEYRARWSEALKAAKDFQIYNNNRPLSPEDWARIREAFNVDKDPI